MSPAQPLARIHPRRVLEGDIAPPPPFQSCSRISIISSGRKSSLVLAELWPRSVADSKQWAGSFPAENVMHLLVEKSGVEYRQEMSN